jgi:predicted acetyltransferase
LNPPPVDGIQIREVTPDRLEELMLPIMNATGWVGSPELRESLLRQPEFDFRLGAWEGDAIVGGVGAFSFDVTVPGGGPVPAAGLTMVGVHPTHRRRGVLTELVRAHLDTARERGQLASLLWATEGQIYGRYGYGMASLQCDMRIDRDRVHFAEEAEPVGRVRLVDARDALDPLRAIWEVVRRHRPGMLSRSREWWDQRRVTDQPFTKGQPPLQRAILEIDGQLAGYALYRQHGNWDDGVAAGELEVIEAFATTPVATRELWRFLFGIDLVRWIRHSLAPVDHPLVLLVAEPARLRMRAKDGLWLRLVDVEGALAKRRYQEGGGVVLDVFDTFCPWNDGRYRVTHEGSRKTDYEPDLRISACDLGSVYLGGFTFAGLDQAGRVEELRSGGVERADQLFRVDLEPWCPEVF